MLHLSTDRLAALGDEQPTSAEAAHLATCEVCARERAAYLHRLIVTHLNSGESVLVVFGESHLMIHKPALDAVLGSPCYVGADMARAAADCR